MKLAANVLISALCWSAQLAAATTGYIYTYDPNEAPRPKAPSRSLSPVAARLLLAQRAGVEEYHSADLASKDVVQAINDFGRRTPLFGTAERARMAFVLLEGWNVSSAAAAPLFASYTPISYEPAPAVALSRGLFIDLAKQSNPSAFTGSDEQTYEQLKSGMTTNGLEDVFTVASSPEAFSQISSRLNEIQVHSITAMLIAPDDTRTTDGSTHSWGTYEMPGAQSPLRKRQQKEEPLEVEPSDQFQPVEFSSGPVSALANVTALPGILPACFTSQSACESVTRNCSGHGRCYKKYTDADADDKSPAKNCYSCQCSATVTKNGEGQTLTTNWGGPACQKKDISVQFWLIALFTIGLMFLVGFAVGEVWGMGDEDLPSVIGAGVSGPVKRS